jgi:competence protein ComEA
MTQVNLAQRLTDGQVLYVPIKGEQVPTNFANEAVASSQIKTTINLNTATKEELQNLEGIGEKKADQILDYRQEHGGFKSIEELKSISGIGTKRFEAIKEQLTI